MIILDNTNEILELVTSAAVNVDVHAAWMDHTSSGGTPGSTETAITTAATTTIVAAPGASTQRQVRFLSITNRGTAAQTVRLQKDVAATDYYLGPAYTLAAGDTLRMSDDGAVTIVDSSGRTRTQATDTSGVTGTARGFFKTGTATEAVGVLYSYHKDAGLPGAWAPGTPGLAGRTTDGTTTTDGGCIPFTNPSTGAIYLISANAFSTVTGTLELWDVLWVNSGIVVTTTTGQTINSVTWPARDVNGSTNGEGVNVAIVATAATTNVGAVTNTTLTYTNSDGTASRTATMPSTIPGGGWPATAVIGTVQPFYLAAGDRGVRSIQTVTLGTSYGGGSISLIAYRPIILVPQMTASVPAYGIVPEMTPGIRLFNGTCLLPFRAGSATTATNISGVITMVER